MTFYVFRGLTPFSEDADSKKEKRKKKRMQDFIQRNQFLFRRCRFSALPCVQCARLKRSECVGVGWACQDKEERDRLYYIYTASGGVRLFVRGKREGPHFIAVAGLWCFQPEV